MITESTFDSLGRIVYGRSIEASLPEGSRRRSGEALTRAARRARKSPDELLREFVVDGLQEKDDHRAVLVFRKKRGRTYSHAEVKKRLGLES